MTGVIPWVEAGSRPTDWAADMAWEGTAWPCISSSPLAAFRATGAVTIPPGISKRLPQFLQVARAPWGGIFLEEIR